MFYYTFFNVPVHSFVILQHCYYTCIADLLIMFVFAINIFLLMNTCSSLKSNLPMWSPFCLIFVLYNLQKLSAESFTKYMCMYISCPTKTDLFLNLIHTNPYMLLLVSWHWHKQERMECPMNRNHTTITCLTYM